MAQEKTSILFLCTGNSARSILAEGIANGGFGDRLRAASAGSHPRGVVHELALETLADHGIDTAGLRSKSWDEVSGEPFDLVVTLCDEASRETCPSFPGAPAQVHWSLPDPPAADDPPAMFASVFEALVEAIGGLADGDPNGLLGRARSASGAIERRLGRQPQQ